VRIVVLGGTRFIGPAVVRQLSQAGHEVMVFHRGDTEADSIADVVHLHGDRQNLAAYAGHFARHVPDVVLDMLPMSERDARAVMTTFTGIARRVVALSSMDVYRAYGRLHRTEPGPADPVPYREEGPLRERLYPYGDDYDKIPVEQMVMGDPSLPGTVLRLPAVYGPGDYQHRLFYYLKRMDDQRPAILLDEGIARWRWTRGYVENVAAAIALAVTDARASGKVYNVGETHPLTELEWVRAIGQAAGWTGTVVVVPRDHLPLALRWWGDADTEHDLVTDTSRIRTELGYTESVSQGEALQHTMEWERAHPPVDFPPDLLDYAAEDAVLATVRI
jgi:nucleoside-diphosphate-sugar epimerase